MSTKGNYTFAKLMAASILLVSVTSACSLIPKEEEVLKPPLVTPTQENYDTADVVKGSIIKQVKGTGIFESVSSKYEEFAVVGKVTAVNVRQGNAVKKGDVLIQLDVAGLELNVKIAERDLEQAKLDLENAKQSRDAQVMKVKLLQQEIAQQKLDEARAQLAGKTLVAEIDGIATFVDPVKAGDTVQLNRTYVRIDDPTQLRLSYSASNVNDISDVQVGMKADVTYKGEKLSAKIVQTPSTAPQTEVKALADRYAKALYLQLDTMPKNVKINDTTDIAIITQIKENVIKIPTRFLGSYLGRNFVKILDGESIKEVDVEKGIESLSPPEVEIVKGLKDGQKVILQQ